MELAIVVKMVSWVVGGLGIFMLGMKYMSDGLQATAGNRLRTLIAAVTNNRFMAVGIGTLVTCILQSSSVTTVMVVGFVNSGFMTLAQAIGVIMGANIGTTITGWILVLEIGKHGLPILGVAALLYRFLKSEKWRFIALLFMGLGMIFFGLELMKDGFKPIRAMPEFEAWFHAFDADTYLGVMKCVLVGCILTCIVQSSSATLGITIGLATTGVIPFHTAAALVMGENIGTTITAWLASFGTTSTAKRAAYAHILFNVIGVLWITAIFQGYLHFLEWFYSLIDIDPNLEILTAGDQVVAAADIMVENGKEFVRGADGALVEVMHSYPHVTKGIALVHSLFNITNVIFFLPFVGVMSRFLTRIIPEKAYQKAPHLTSLDRLIHDTPGIALEQSRNEIIRMADHLEKMMDWLRSIIARDELPEGKLADDIMHGEEDMDTVQSEIVVYLTEMLSGRMTHDLVVEARKQIRMADEYESVSDYIVNILKMFRKMRRDDVDFAPEGVEGMLKLHQNVDEYLRMVNDAYRRRNADIVAKVHSQGSGINRLTKDLRNAHLGRLSTHDLAPLASVTFTNMLNAYRRIKDHVENFAEAMAATE